MSYYPKSQIQTNKYTNGKEFVFTSTGVSYKGYYWQTSTGEYFSGKNPSEIPSFPLSKIQQPEESTPFQPTSEWTSDYPSSLTNTKPGLPPKSFITIPTESDYNLGEFERYFTKKSNQNIYFEISKEDYTKLNNKSSKIQYQLYIPIKMSWQLVGDSPQVNKNSAQIIENTQKLPGFVASFKGQFGKYNKDRIL